MASVIYCISGLGAGEKIFDNLKVNDIELRHISWIQPLKKEKIEAYAVRMAAAIQEPAPLLLGVSFGGMMAIEIAKQFPVRKLFVVSSVKSVNELPVWMKNAGRLQLNKIFPVKPFRLIEPISNNRLGISCDEEKRIVRAYRRSADPAYLNWAVDQVLNWRNNWQPDNLIHIHGDKDKIFPIKKITATHVVKGGTHLMIYNRAQEISQIIMNSV
jgi:pimeloyl-ACP methyl ester carboxylesterase